MSAFVGAVSAREPRNWERCKEAGLWGVPGLSRPTPKVALGDRLFIWKGRAGFVAEVVVTGPARVPQDRNEAPWPGGLGRWRSIFPIRVVREVSESYKLPFVRDRQEITGISSNSLRFGLVHISDEAGDALSAALAEREPVAAP